MGQVPRNEKRPTLAIVGRGRLALHWKFYLQNSGHDIVQWHRGLNTKFQEAVADCEIIFLAISDSQIIPFFENHRIALPNTQWVHFSGTLSHIQMKALHPLASFGSTLMDLKTYEEMPLVTESENPFIVGKLLGLRNPLFHIRRSEKPRYHAQCVLSNNLTTFLWQNFFEYTKEVGIDFESSKFLLVTTMANLQANWRTALTGPLSRGDQITIDSNLNALQADKILPLYKAFVQAFESPKQPRTICVEQDLSEMGL